MTTVLQGSVRRDGRKLKVNAKLIDGSTGFQLWSGSFDREVTDIFAVQAELAAAVIDAIVPAARGDTVAAPRRRRISTPTITTCWDSLPSVPDRLPGSRVRGSARAGRGARPVLRAQAHAALANSCCCSRAIPGRERADSLARAEQAAYKALALDASLSDAHGALGNVLRYAERPGAEDEYKRALELNPNNAIVTHDYTVLLAMQPGREADAVALGERILLLDPRSAIAWTNKLGRVFETEGAAAYQKQFETAIKIFAGDADGLETLVLAVETHAPDIPTRPTD